MNFHDVNLPKSIQIFAVGQPTFLTSIVATASGKELRNLDRGNALQRYLLKNCCLSVYEFEGFNSFFRARRGRSFAFRFFDCADHRVIKQHIASGDGSICEMQLFKIYNDEVSPYLRKITKPIKDSVKLYINDTKIDGMLINYEKGTITLSRALGVGELLTADFMFDVMVRFGCDSFDYNYRVDGTVELSTIELLEVLQ